MSSSSLHMVRVPNAAAHVFVIVPFCDRECTATTLGARTRQLRHFVPYMGAYLRAADEGAPAMPSFTIIVVEQNKSCPQKFNRGAMCNLGFQEALRHIPAYATASDCWFIFHDVDLLPSLALRPCYVHLRCSPLHIAQVWSRYNSNPRYFGGVTAFSRDVFAWANGFPNDFWGWGGEDDELYRRVTTELSVSPLVPADVLPSDVLAAAAAQRPLMTDLENMDLEQKLASLRENQSAAKCLDKRERLAAGVANWRENGLDQVSLDWSVEEVQWGAWGEAACLHMLVNYF